MSKDKKNLAILFLVFLILIIHSYVKLYNNYGGRKGIDTYFTESFNNICYDEKTKGLVDYCDIDITGLPGSPDTYTIFYQIMRQEYMAYLPLFGILILTVLSLWQLNKIFKSKYLYYYVQRRDYKSFIKSMLKSAYKYALVIPFVVVLIFLLSLTLSTHGANELTRAMRLATFDKVHYDTPFFLIFYTIYMINMWLFYINIGLFVESKNRRLVFNVIEVLVIYFLLEMILENYPIYFWVFDIYNPTQYSIFVYLLVSVIYFVTSLILVLIVYKNKEKELKRIGG